MNWNDFGADIGRGVAGLEPVQGALSDFGFGGFGLPEPAPGPALAPAPAPAAATATGDAAGMATLIKVIAIVALLLFVIRKRK